MKFKTNIFLGKFIKIVNYYRKKPTHILPCLYLFILALAAVLIMLNRIFPFFDNTACINLGGVPVCTLLGVYVATVASLPGYVVMGGVIRIIPLVLPLLLSYLILLVVNIFIYYIIGLTIWKMFIYKENSEKLSILLVISVFLLLALLLFFIILL